MANKPHIGIIIRENHILHVALHRVYENRNCKPISIIISNLHQVIAQLSYVTTQVLTCLLASSEFLQAH